MRTRTFKIIFAATLLCALQATVALPETAPASSLLLNGQAITPEAFANVRRGTISLAKSYPASDSKTPAAFYIYLKRNGKIVDAEAYAHNNAVMRWELADILRLAKAGDQLIIDPLGARNAEGRQVLTISPTQIVPQFEWFYTAKNKKDNC